MKSKLIEILNTSPSVGAILRKGDQIKLNNWYITAGAIPTVVWNNLVANPPDKFLNDIDIVYYDGNNITQEAENRAANRVRNLFPEVKHKIDVKNQARVHIWYRDKFGSRIHPYESTEDGIDMWMSVTAIGVRYEKGHYKVYAPYGLEDLFSMNVKPNSRIISAEKYRSKIKKWKKQWPEIVAQDYDRE